MDAAYSRDFIGSIRKIFWASTGRLFLSALTALLLFCSVNKAAAMSYLSTSDVPLFVHFFVIFMALYHAAMFIMLKEIQRVSPSAVWASLRNANYLGIGLTLVTASLLYELSSASEVAHVILILVAVFDIVTHYLANTVLYYLITPIIKEKIEIFSDKYLIYYAFFAIGLYLIANIIYTIEYPPSPSFIVLFFFILFSTLVVIHYFSTLLYISKGYTELGFVRKPFFIGGIGMVSYLLSIGLMVYFIFHYLNPSIQKGLYYDISLYPIFFVFTILYFMQFVIEYPSLLQPRWKVLMPFDLPRVAATITLAFLTVSAVFSTLECPGIQSYQTIPFGFVPVFLLPIFVGVIVTFTSLKLLSSRTKLKYWRYLGYGQYIHVTVTFYVLSVMFLSWDSAGITAKVFYTFFGLAAFAFYLFFALDLRTIILDQNIRLTFDRMDVTRYLVCLCSWFVVLLLVVSASYDRFLGAAPVGLISYPLLLLFIAFFLIAFGTYLSVTHKGFEEILGKNIWSEASYLFAFIAFILVYLIYSSLGTHLQRFPYHDVAFFGYFMVLVIEIVSTRTLAGQYKPQQMREKDLSQLLNYYAENFLRTDYLEELWSKILDQYVAPEAVKSIGFDPSRRRFDLEQTDEKTRISVAVRMLLGMHEVPNVERAMLLRKSRDETKDEIANILKERVLMLPAELRASFDERKYYPQLFERTINDLITPLKTFIPLGEQREIFTRLKKREALLNTVRFEENGIRIDEGARFARGEFLELFQLYLEAMEERFPFKRFLLQELVREEIKEVLERYEVNVGDVLDRVPTGLEEMDRIMAGGFAKGSSTLLLAEETRMKQKLLLAFVEHGLLEGNFAVYATSKRSYDQIMGELFADVEDLEDLTILDFYEQLFAEDKITELIEADNRLIVPLNKILYQRSLVKVIKDLPHDAPKIVIIDVVDDFSRYYATQEIFELLQKQLEGLKRWTCTSLIVISPNSHLILKEGVDEVKKHFDNVLILSGDDKETSVLIEKLYHGTPSKHVVRL